MGCGGSKTGDSDSAGGGGGGGGGGGAAGGGAAVPEKKPTRGAGNIIKLVLLGAGEAGKSTIFKQMKLIGGTGFPLEERQQLKGVVYSAVAIQAKILAAALLQANSPEVDDGIRALSELQPSTAAWTPELGTQIGHMWSKDAVRHFFMEERSRITQLADGTEYLFDNVGRITSDGYVPTEQDLLRVRIRTVGYDTAEYKYSGMSFSVWDVGGQRVERRHWRTVAEGAKAAIFVAALSEYDQRLREDQGQFRIAESLALWEEVCAAPVTNAMSMILFLNKVDIFKQKISIRSIRCFFTDYTGPDTYEASSQYIKEQFLARKKKRDVYTHLVIAVDTDNVRQVWKDVIEMLRTSMARAVF